MKILKVFSRDELLGLLLVIIMGIMAIIFVYNPIFTFMLVWAIRLIVTFCVIFVFIGVARYVISECQHED